MFDLMLRCFGMRRKGEKEYPYETYFKIATMTMQIIGLWKNGNKRELNFYIVVPFISLMVTGNIGIILAIYETRRNFSRSSETMLYLILLIHTLNAYLSMIYNLKRINRNMAAIEETFLRSGRDLSESMANKRASSQSSTIFFIKFVIGVVCSVHVSHFIGSKCYLPNSKNKSLFFDIVLPYRPLDSDLYYYYAFIFEILIYIVEGCVNLSSITLNVGFLNILCVEIEMYGVSLENIPCLVKSITDHHLSRRIRRDLMLGEESIDEGKYIIRKIVDHHRYLISLMKDMQAILSFIVLDMFVTCEFMLCLCSFQIYQIYSTTTFVSLIKNICMLAALIVHEFVYFFFGQRLVTKTQDLQRSLYFCEWYKESKSFKSSMNIIQSRMNKPFTILAGKIIPVTLASFITCLQAAFSYFNLLRALSHT